jgi:hypothetical protein
MKFATEKSSQQEVWEKITEPQGEGETSKPQDEDENDSSLSQ